MSEYQFYEFVTVDKQLTSDEMNQLRSISTRADISSTCFCNTYNYSDLRAEPERMLLDYFDAFVYVSNFAHQRFIIKRRKVIEAERRKQQKALEKHIEEVAAREPAYWNRLEELLEKRGSHSVYDEIKEKARNLKLVAQTKNRVDDFEHRILLLKEAFSKKKNHLQALEKVL